MSLDRWLKKEPKKDEGKKPSEIKVPTENLAKKVGVTNNHIDQLSKRLKAEKLDINIIAEILNIHPTLVEPVLKELVQLGILSLPHYVLFDIYANMMNQSHSDKCAEDSK